MRHCAEVRDEILRRKARASFIETFAVALLIGGLLTWSIASPLAAQTSCYGCNIVDDGTFSPSLVGRTLYFRLNGNVVPVTVTRVDQGQGIVYWRMSNGMTGWDRAVLFYTKQRSDERNAVACLFLCSSEPGNGGSSAPSRQADDANERYRQKQDCMQSCRRNTNYGSDQSVALGQDCIQRCDRAY